MLRTAFTAFMVLCTFAGTAVAGPDEDAVRHLLHATFDKPDDRLVVDPVVVAVNYAIAGWTQGGTGGRALLRNAQGRWTLILCAGDGIRTAEALRQAGLPADAAATLAQMLARAEQAVPADRVAIFSRFEGLVRMDEAGDHPPAHHQQH
jgi:hypothetical protein